MVRAIFILYRRKDLSRDEFRRLWLEEHAPLVKTFPDLRDFVQCPATTAFGGGEPGCDGVGWISFDNQEAMDAAFASPEGQKIMAFLPEFLDTERTYAVVSEIFEIL
jgi:uncharacterized protein (TIGR02118 family)